MFGPLKFTVSFQSDLQVIVIVFQCFTLHLNEEKNVFPNVENAHFQLLVLKRDTRDLRYN